MLSIYVLTVLMYAGKLNRYEINYFVLFLVQLHELIQCNAYIKKLKYIKESIMRYISPSKFLE